MRWNLPDWTEFPPPFDRYVRLAYKSGDLVLIRSALRDAQQLSRRQNRHRSANSSTYKPQTTGPAGADDHAAKVISLDAYRSPKGSK